MTHQTRDDATENPDRMIVTCIDCPFERVVSTDGDETPIDVLREHGRETGHTLTLDRPDD